jgi:hypothetical protein
MGRGRQFMRDISVQYAQLMQHLSINYGTVVDIRQLWEIYDPLFVQVNNIHQLCLYKHVVVVL